MDWRTIWKRSILLPLMLLWACVLLCVSPRGDFPLNDDWIYAQAVQQILDTGIYAGHLYADPVVVFQAYYGALISHVFGFNFTVLRLTSYVGLLLAAWGASRCAQQLGLGRMPTLLLGTLVLANPLLLNLGYTFMTDVPFLALAHWSIYWFLKALERKKALPIAVGSSLAAAAYLIRQFGVLLPMAFIGTILLLWLLRRHRISARHVLACILPWSVALLVLQLLTDSSGGLSAQLRFYLIGKTPEEFILNTFRHIAKHGTYLGLFLLPLTLTKVWLLLSRQEKWSTQKWCVFGGFFVLIAASLLTTDILRMPYSKNMLYDFGVGPILLRGIVADGKLHTPVQIGYLWWPITIFGWCTAALLLVEVLARFFRSCQQILIRGNESRDSANIFLFLVGVAFSLGFFLPGLDILYDRYYVMSLLPVGLLFAPSVRDAFRTKFSKLALVSTLFLLSFSTICLQDYMAWNGARWDAIATLTQEYEATPDEIDGGYEFNGLYNSAALIDEEDPRRDYGPKGGWVIDDRYAVSIRPRENFETLERVPYFSWLGLTRRAVLIQRRIDNGT